MEFIQHTCKEDKAYILPIGDIHIGDSAFGRNGKRKLLENLDWAKEHEDVTRIVLMGDIFNIASRSSKTSPYGTNTQEIVEGIDIFRPYASLILGAIRGNHEHRLVDSHGFDPTEIFCKALDIPYLGISGLVKLRVGSRDDNADWCQQTYYMAIHHTTGGGGKLGNALSGVEKFSQIIPGCDVYAGGHNHQLVSGVREHYVPTASGPKMMKAHFVSCGSYLDYPDSYAEEKLYIPGKLGSPRIRFSGTPHRDVHISI